MFRSALKAASLGCVLCLAAASSQELDYLPDLPVDHPEIRYAERTVHDPVAELSRALDAGGTELDGLAAILATLDVPTDSQMLVFSKTSFQASKIAPDNPRAIYFNDEIAVAYVRGSDMIEIAAIDPQIGPVFYTADLRTVGTEGFERRQVCLQCHLGPATSGVPGLFVGSVFPGPTGRPARPDAIITDHRTALEERWGGWYVNATRGQQEDRSNGVASNPARPLSLDEDRGRNLTHLYGKFDPSGYLERVSDIIALMTFEHQTQMLNYLTRVAWEHRIGPKEDPQLDADLDALVRYMLFLDEVPLPEPLEGVATFTQTFPERGPRDSKGRSLRDFDLERRLFRYPLSYMVYSRSFDALPEELKEEIYRRLYDALEASDEHGEAFQILCETKPGLPDYFVAKTKRGP